MEDRNFDDLAEKFSRKIYADKKGQIRLAVVWRDLKEFLPELAGDGALNILDAGGGPGHISAELALQGHHVVHSDPSVNMLKMAEINAKELGVKEGAIDYRLEKVQEHSPLFFKSYDVVIFHAVLEWLGDPFSVLTWLLQYVRPGGALSLLFYNRHSVILTNLFKGNFRKVQRGDLGGSKRSLTPINPINPDNVYTFLQRSDYSIEVVSGVRVFNDYMSKATRDQRSLEDTLELEFMFCREVPYRSIARYIHVIARAPQESE